MSGFDGNAMRTWLDILRFSSAILCLLIGLSYFGWRYLHARKAERSFFAPPKAGGAR